MFNFDAVAAYQVRFDSETSALRDGQDLAQCFTSLERLLYRIELLFSPVSDCGGGSVQFELYEGRWVDERPDGWASPLASTCVELSRLAGGGWRSFEFSPLEHSQGRVYTMIFKVTGAGRLTIKKNNLVGGDHSVCAAGRTGTLTYRAVALRNRAMFENFKRFRDGLTSAALWVEHLPLMLRLEISKACNQKCIMCQHGSSDFRLGETETKHMSYGTFEDVAVPLLPTAIELVAFGLGEPFLNKDLLRMLKRAKTVNPLVRITVSTNGTLLTEQMIREIIDGQLIDILQISIDGASEATYAKIRKRVKAGNDYAVAFGALVNTIGYKRESGRYYPRVKTEMIVNKHTCDEVFSYVRQMTDLGVEIILLDSVKGNYPGLGLSDCQDLAGLYAQMMEARRYTESHGVALEGPLFGEISAALAQQGKALSHVG